MSLQLDIWALWKSPLADEAVLRFERDWADSLAAANAASPEESPDAWRARLSGQFRWAWSQNDPKSLAGWGLALHRAGALADDQRRPLAWALLAQNRPAEAVDVLRPSPETGAHHRLLLATALAGTGAFPEAAKALEQAEAGLTLIAPEAGLDQELDYVRRRTVLADPVLGWWAAQLEIGNCLGSGRRDLAAERVRSLYRRWAQALRTLVEHASTDHAQSWGAAMEQTASRLVLGQTGAASRRLILGLGQTPPQSATQVHEALHLARAIAALEDPAGFTQLIDAIRPVLGGAKRKLIERVCAVLSGEADWSSDEPLEAAPDALYALGSTLLVRAGHPGPAIRVLGGMLDRPQPFGMIHRDLVVCSGAEAMGRIALEPQPRDGAPRIFDIFPYNGEIETLKIKLHEMAPWVHRFVIVEAAQTFSGKPKPIHLPGQAAELTAFMPQILHVVVPQFPDHAASAWAREFHQRDQGVAALQGLCAPHDLVLISDADEVVDRCAIQDFAGEFTVLKMDLFNSFYDYRRRFPAGKRLGSLVMMRARHLASTSPSVARLLLIPPLKPNRIEPAGWHFTSVGTAADIAHKMDSYSHQENNRSDNLDRYREVIERIRSGPPDPNREICPLEELPAYLRENRARLAHLMLQGG